MKYSEDFLKKIISVGMLGYSIKKIINVLDIEDNDIAEFTKDFYDTSSQIRKAYEKGIDKADYFIDIKLFEQAKQGDLNSIKKYEERKKLQMQIEEYRNKKNR